MQDLQLSFRTPIEPLFLSRRDAAQVLAISLRALAYLLAEGRLKGRKLGGRTVIAVEELRRSPGVINERS